ncbi:hypothetical protein BV25DRAFT_1917502 [Artomyces pyxidatus]|uniref:Uncharacterized protein n=1 Tax=Artomyces pyxidatus TaxID=48021 RepID=A0ACB8SVP8_9AGAM|nr:hypothetical protein BV25DRAFT_1917502 [Artomyces pyxidatus]
MAFFSSSGSDIDEQRLKRSPSFDRVHGRSRRPSGGITPALPSAPASRSVSVHSAAADRRQPSSAQKSLPKPMQSAPTLVLNTLQFPQHPRAVSQHSSISNGGPSRSSGSPSPRKTSPSIPQDQSLDTNLRPNHLASSLSLSPGSTQPNELRQLPPPPEQHPPKLYGTSTGLQSGSLSDSGTRGRPLRLGDHSPTSISRVTAHLSPLDARHPSPTSPGTRSSGTVSDGASSDRAASPLLASRLDVKRLLSKPAAPSRASTISITSDSDSPAGACFVRKPSVIRGDSAERWPSRETRDTSTRSIIASAEYALTSQTRSRTMSALAVPTSKDSSPASSSKEKEKRPRNVLRKSSAGAVRAGLSSAPPATATIPEARNSKETRNSSPSTPSPIVNSYAALLPDLSMQRSPRRLSPGSAPVTRTSSGSRSPQPSPTPVPKLTPAGAIALAYKEQDVRRERLAAAARSEDLPREKSLPPRPLQDGPGNSPDDDANAPYYTVFGSTSGRVVAVGSPEDTVWSYVGDFDRKTTGSASGSASAPTSVRQSLTRKVSGRFRRTKTVTPGADASVHKRGRPSLQERRSISLPKEPRKSLRVSIDGFVDVEADLSADRSGSSGKRAESSKSTPDGSPQDGRWAKGKEKEREEESSPGGKLWKLVKRISTGGLRDRYQSGPSEPPPPVPAIPKDLLPLPTRMTLEVHTPTSSMLKDGGGAMGRFMDSRMSMSAVRPSTAPAQESPTLEIPRRSLASSSKPNSGKSGRPSTSPSPQSSSDLASQFFHKSHSPRSSSSSYGEELPPLPSRFPKQHNFSPQEPSHRPDRKAESAGMKSPQSGRTHSKSSTMDAATSPISSSQTPRRGRSSSTKSRNSPDIPMFSVSGAVNNFISRRPSLNITQDDHPSPSPRIAPPPVPTLEVLTTSSPAPPRPARSIHRPTLTPPATSPAAASFVPPTPAPAADAPDTLSLSYRSRDSIGGHSNASTARPLPPAGSPAVAQLTFRELDGSPRQVWTKQQKEDKWDDLLERSAMAGGTLHLGEGGLLSDNIRFSSYSEGLN